MAMKKVLLTINDNFPKTKGLKRKKKGILEVFFFL